MVLSRLSTVWKTYRDARHLAHQPEQKGEYRLLRNLCLAMSMQALRSPHPNRIAAIRLDNIGDFVLWLDGARAIRRRYPNPEYELTLIAPSTWSSFASASGLFDDIFEIDLERFLRKRRHRRQVFGALAAKGFGTVINPTYSRSFWTDDCVALATQAPERIGNRGDLMNKPDHLSDITNSWYTQLIPIQEHDTHELERNWSFAAAFDPSIQKKSPQLPLPMIRRPDWLTIDEPYFVLFIGGSKSLKIWPVNCFAEIARRLVQLTGWRGLICGSPSDSAIATKLVAQLAPFPIENAVGRTSIAELAGVVAASRLVVSNDSSAIHIAAATGTPAVCIAGGGHFGRFVPYPKSGPFSAPVVSVAHQMPCFNCNWHCIYPVQNHEPAPCVAQISVDAVWRAVVTTVPECGGGPRLRS